MTKSSNLEPLTDERELMQEFTATLFVSRIKRDQTKKELDNDRPNSIRATDSA